MSATPYVSIIMSVYNSADTLAETMDSVLSQEGVAFEIIVVDDGSTDGSATILDGYAQHDSRVRVIHQTNMGLTRALIRGCAEARGRYIARQDAGGDVSLPGRLARQYTFLETNADVVMTSCGTRFMGPEGEVLFEIVKQGDELQRGLEQLKLSRVRGPSHHGSVLFRRAVYQAVGGYRQEFWVAQDLDLWMRLAEIGLCIATSEVFYQARLTRGAISHIHRREQRRVASTILRCAAIRRSGGNERNALQKSGKDDRELRRLWVFGKLQDARFYYFVGSLLRQQQPNLAKVYYQRALKSWFLHPRALLRWWLLDFKKRRTLWDIFT